MRASLISLLLCSSTLAQTIWNVPTGADVQPFITQASPGDILQLGAWHAGFDVDKGVTIVGQATGTEITGPAPSGTWLSVAVPVGQRASLLRLRINPGGDGTLANATLHLQHGASAIADVSIRGSVLVLAGEHIVQRFSIGGGGMQVMGGLCAITDANLRGHDPDVIGPTFNTMALAMFGGRVVASRLVARGGHGALTMAAQPAVHITGGNGFFTDCDLTGGDGASGPGVTVPGAAAMVSVLPIASVDLARTTLTSGAVGPAVPSYGYQVVPEMVGMSCLAAPTRGATFQAIATAGSSQGLLAIVGGFDATANVLPPIVEPLFGVPAQLVALTVAAPVPGAQVPQSLSVPNVASLYGAEIWLQAIQLTGTAIRASTVVGGTIR
jgi:hypothetical protein